MTMEKFSIAERVLVASGPAATPAHAQESV
jgi:hypothetical protein